MKLAAIGLNDEGFRDTLAVAEGLPEQLHQRVQRSRRYVIQGCHVLLSRHFNLTVELPLKTIVRGHSWTVMPVTRSNGSSGVSKLQLKEMGSRQLLSALCC